MKGLLSLVARGALTSLDYATDLIKGTLGEQERDGLERVLPFGFAHYPKEGAQIYSLAPNGSTSQTIIFCIADRRYQVDLEEGEVALYNAEGASIVLKANGDVQVTAPGKILLGEGADDPVVRLSDLQALADVVESHTHDINSTSGLSLVAPSGGGPVTGTATTTAGPSHTATASAKVDAV